MHNKYLLTDEWKIIEKGWRPELQQSSESLFSIGNGQMGQRANFEEDYSGQSLQGSYLGGVYYPDKTRVGWWKNGYPEYFAKVLNSVNWIGLHLKINGESLDLAKAKKVDSFYRELNMKEGYLLRRFEVEISSGKKIAVEAQRFVSMVRKEVGALRYDIKLLNFDAELEYRPYLDFDVINSDSNYDEKFWESQGENVGSQKAVINARTRKSNFEASAAMRYELYVNGEHLTLYPETAKREKYAENSFSVKAQAGKTYSLHKFAAIATSFLHPEEDLSKLADQLASKAMKTGFSALLKEQKEDWQKRWEEIGRAHV